jgi:hypothetical protein
LFVSFSLTLAQKKMPAISGDHTEDSAPTFKPPLPAASEEVVVHPDGTKTLEPKTSFIFRWSFWFQIFHVIFMVAMLFVLIFIVIKCMEVVKRVEDKINAVEHRINDLPLG